MPTTPIRNKTAIVGVGYTPVVRHADRPLGSIAVEAALAAIADAGLTRDDIDGYIGCPGAPNASAVHVDGVDEVSAGFMVAGLGLKEPGYVADLSGLPSGPVVAGAQALTAGICNYVLIVRAMYNPTKVRYQQVTSSEVGGREQYSIPYGIGGGGGNHAQWLQRYMHDYGATREEMFTVVNTERSNAQLNPGAYWNGKDIEIEDYMNARWIYEPMCIFDCDLPVTTAGAVVMTTAERARDLPHKPAYVSGFAHTQQRPNTIFEVSGVDRQDVPVAMLYDGFTPFIYQWLERLGYCGQGEAHHFVQNGRIAPGGEIPINTFGGQQGEGRLHGMGHLREGTMQVMGRCGPRQVAGAQHCLVALGFVSGSFWSLMLSRA